MRIRPKKSMPGVHGLDLLFKSGTVMHVHATKWSWTVTRGTTNLTWTTPDGDGRRLVHADLDELVCIVECAPR